MGCLVCNIFRIMNKKDGEGQKEFFEELSYDIASNHPEIVERINYFVKVLKEKR